MTIFYAVFDVALTVIEAILERIHHLSLVQAGDLFHKAMVCLYRIMAVQVTLIRTPERITPAQLARLAKAQRYIERLVGRPLDFSAFTGSADVSSASPAPAAKLAPSSPSIPHSAFSIPHLLVPQSARVIGPLGAPGAVLANVCKELVTLLSRLPEPIQFFPGTADGPVRNPAIARTAISSSPTPSTSSQTPSPAPSTLPPKQQTTSNKQTTNSKQTTSNSQYPVAPSNTVFSSALRNQLACSPATLSPAHTHTASLGRHRPPP